MKVGMKDQRVATGLFVMLIIWVIATLLFYSRSNDYPDINQNQIDSINRVMKIRNSYY